MKLAHLAVAGFRGLPDRAFDLCGRSNGSPHDVVLVTGDGGAGKTSFLDAILAAKEDVGAYGPRRPAAALVRPGARAARVEVRWLLSEEERRRAGLSDAEVSTVSIFGEGAPALSTHPEGLRSLFADYTRAPERGKVEYFHAERALPAGSGTRGASGDTSPVMAARARLGTSLDKYRPLRSYLIDAILNDGLALAETVREHGIALRRTEPDALALIRESLRPLLRDKAFDGIDRPETGYRVRFRSRDGEVVDLDELSASERQAVLFGVTFLRSGVHGSLVLIDSPELHIHPSRQADFFAALCARGRDNQIVAATTSLAVLGSVRADQVVDLSRVQIPLCYRVPHSYMTGSA
jgi:hypothetical protein